MIKFIKRIYAFQLQSWIHFSSEKINAINKPKINYDLISKHTNNTNITGTALKFSNNLHCDVFNQDKMLINGVEMRVRLVRSKDAFCLMDVSNDGKFSVKIKEVALIVRRVKINPGVLLAHANALSKTTAKYPITRVEVKSFTLHTGVLGDTLDNVILGQQPKRIIIGFVEYKAFNGNRKFNPFNFLSINYLSLYIDGVQIPSK